MIATSGFLTALECTKFVFGLGAGGAYSAPRAPIAGIRWTLLLRESGEEEIKGEEEMKRKREEGTKGKGEGPPLKLNSWIRP